MSKFRDAAQQALEALKKSHPYSNSDRDLDKHSEAIHALRAALAEQPAEQESVKWRDVAGFDSYEVSSNGDLRNKNTGRIIAKNLAGAGYVKADLWANGQRTQTTVHRLVAEAFLGPAEGREVNHKNGNKQDNRVSNLEWCSRSDNVNHGYYKLGIRVKPIRVTNIATGEVWCYPSANEAVRDGFHSARIHECLSGKRTSHGGFSFEYDTAPQLTIPPGYKLVPDQRRPDIIAQHNAEVAARNRWGETANRLRDLVGSSLIRLGLTIEQMEVLADAWERVKAMGKGGAA